MNGCDFFWGEKEGLPQIEREPKAPFYEADVPFEDQQIFADCCGFVHS